MSATRAITVLRPASDIWPWLAQLGQRQGGFYSYDFLENLAGCRIHSADRVVAAWQSPEVGADVALAPGVDLSLAFIQIGRALVLRGAPPMFGKPAPYDFTWAFVLNEAPDGTTRLVVRERYHYTRRWAALLVEPVQPISFLMSQKMLRGIRDRAQVTSPRRIAGSPRWTNSCATWKHVSGDRGAVLEDRVAPGAIAHHLTWPISALRARK